jgi:hypothetical protein
VMLGGGSVLNARPANFELSSRYNRAPTALPFGEGPISPQGLPQGFVNHMFSLRAGGSSAPAFGSARPATNMDLPLTRPGDKT